MTLAVALLTAVAGTLALTPLVAAFAEARQLYDAPGEGRRIHSVPVPRLGGIALFAGLLIGVAFSGAVAGSSLGAHGTSFLLVVLVGAGVVFVAGLLDDLRGLSPMAKLLAQAGAATIFFWGGVRVPTSFLPLEFGGGADLIVSLILTVLWVATISNAFNLIDGLDGLAGGIGVIALACTTAVAADSGRPEILILALATLGALLGFLPYNLHPARIFLGDSGSLTLGAVLAVLTLHGVGDGAVSPLRFVPLVALAVPLVDIVVSTLRRWLRGQPVASADRRHIHHQLVARGYSQVQAVLVLYAFTCVLAAWGIAVAMAPPGLALLGVVLGGGVSLAVLLLGFGYLDYHEFVDAAAIVLSAPQRLQRVVRFQIHAGDVARAIGRCGTLGEIREVLSHAAPDFEFLHMDCGSEDTGLFPLRESGKAFGDDPDAVANAWRLDCPVSTLPGSYPIVLRIWCYATGQFRAFNAERVARVIAPALTSWLQEHPAALVRGRGVALAPTLHRTAISDGNRNGGAQTTSEVELLA